MNEEKLLNRNDKLRPLELSGWTWRIKFENQNLFITVNHDGEKVIEVFVTEMLSNGIGLLTSKMLQSNCFTADEIARTLKKINGTHFVQFNGKVITSPEQALAECLILAADRVAVKKI